MKPTVQAKKKKLKNKIMKLKTKSKH